MVQKATIPHLYNIMFIYIYIHINVDTYLNGKMWRMERDINDAGDVPKALSFSLSIYLI